jgi:hypothetical protein
MQTMNYPRYLPAAPQQGMSLKEKILLGVFGIAAGGGIIYLGKKLIDKAIANKAQGKSFENGTPETYAKQVKMAFENDGYWGTDMEALRIVMQQIKSKDELKKVFTAYKKQYGSNMYADMQSELQSSQYNEMLQIMAGKPDKPGQAPTSAQYTAWAKRLKAAFDKTYGFMPGTDEPAIKAVFTEVPTQASFVKVGTAYQRDYGVDMITALKGELEFWEYPEYMQIILKKPKA